MSKEITGLDNIKNLSDAALLSLLFEMEDRLPREVVDEIIWREERMVEPLWNIIRDNYDISNNISYWAIIHATYILGAIGGQETITPLIMSLRYADANDCDWIYEYLPSIFGKIGSIALNPLKQIVEDRSNSWMIRTTALDGMAAVTIGHEKYEREIFDFIASILKNVYEDLNVRCLAGHILLDFRQKNYLNSLLEFAAEEEERKDEDPSYFHSFGVEDVKEELQLTERHLRNYTQSWLGFYNPEEIEQRQKRWKLERSWFYGIRKWLWLKKFSLKLRRIKSEKGDKKN